MPTEKTDVVIVGTGAAGGILAAELAKAGMRVIALERGPRLKTSDFDARDELRFFQRQELRPDPKSQPITWRRNASERATPLGTLNYGNQAGGGTVHYGAVSWRFHEDDFRARSQTTERYGEAAIPADSALTDWPLGYADLEPYYDFIDVEIDDEGRPWRALAHNAAGFEEAIIGTLMEGPALYGELGYLEPLPEGGNSTLLLG